MKCIVIIKITFVDQLLCHNAGSKQNIILVMLQYDDVSLANIDKDDTTINKRCHFCVFIEIIHVCKYQINHNITIFILHPYYYESSHIINVEFERSNSSSKNHFLCFLF